MRRQTTSSRDSASRRRPCPTTCAMKCGMSVAENMFLNRMHKFTRRGLLDRAAMRGAARELMGRFDVRAASEDVAFGGLSGGNQQKAVLARELTQEGLALLIAAQPTRG